MPAKSNRSKGGTRSRQTREARAGDAEATTLEPMEAARDDAIVEAAFGVCARLKFAPLATHSAPVWLVGELPPYNRKLTAST